MNKQIINVCTCTTVLKEIFWCFFSASISKTPKALDKHVEKIKEEIKDSPASGTPKRDSRKRTRGNIQSDTPTTNKRARRT